MAESTTRKVRKGIRTIYNPKVGCNYIIANTETGEEITASTLTIRDKDQKPWRSPKDTPAGEEFFKMKVGSKKTGFTYYKFMNSITRGKCLSEDGQWEFVGRRPNGEILEKVQEKAQEQISTVKVQKAQQAASTKAVAPQESEEPEVEMTAEELREDIMDSEFANPSALNEILNDN